MDVSRRTYGIPLQNMWEKYRFWSKEMHSQDVNAFNNKFYQYALSQPTKEVQQAAILQLNLWNTDIQGGFLHVWIEQKELFDFLQNDVPLRELPSIKQYLADNGTHVKERFVQSTLSGFVRYDIALHVPDSEDGYAFSFCLMSNNTIELFFVDGDGAGQIHESEYNIAKSRNDEDSMAVERNFCLAVNLLAYMECFPECVRDGVPMVNNETVYQPNGRSVLLDISEKVLEEGKKGAKRPHMRKGYFKCLSSEFYRNKRGQIVFVHETMVKGRSKTVEMSDDERKLNKFKCI